MNLSFHLKEKFENSWTNKDGCRRRDINDGVFINEKEKKSSRAKTVVRETFLLYHLLSFVVTHCTTCFYSLSLVITRCITLLSFYNDPFSTILSSFKKV